MKIQKRTIALCIYFGLLILPIYWMLNMSLRTNADILANFALYPADLTFVTISRYSRIQAGMTVTSTP
jgi:glycerol transport system permease protein